MARYWIVAAVVGECCTDPHIKDDFIDARNASEAMAKFQDRLVHQHYDVGDVSVVKKTPALRRYFARKTA